MKPIQYQGTPRASYSFKDYLSFTKSQKKFWYKVLLSVLVVVRITCLCVCVMCVCTNISFKLYVQ